MATAKQELGALGERLVVQNCACPRCKQSRTLVALPANFKCADIICDFCGYLAQVKASTSANGSTPPRLLLGAAWGPQKQRMDAGIYFPIFLVLGSFAPITIRARRTFHGTALFGRGGRCAEANAQGALRLSSARERLG